MNDLPDEATAITVFNEFEWEEQLNVLEARLSQRERDLCSLVKERYTWREIGEKMGLAEDSARMTYRRALSRIQKELSEGGEFKSGGRVARTD
ncbi:MAG: sigma-70 family RNA polymerase sigma factor [Planctomycetia bacterium]|nr:sigma-70 family RNA polymerase sigma factor [Planctomycetia bacterium]